MRKLMLILLFALLVGCSGDRDAREALNQALQAQQEQRYEAAYNGFLRVTREYADTEAATEAHKQLAGLSNDLEAMVRASIDLYRTQTKDLPDDLGALFPDYIPERYQFVTDVFAYESYGNSYWIKAK